MSYGVLRSETFYAPASWLSLTKILSITEKRALLNSTGIDIHSEACYVKVTASPGEERMRVAHGQKQGRRQGNGMREKPGKKNWRGGCQAAWLGRTAYPQFAIHKTGVGGENSLVFHRCPRVSSSSLMLFCPFFNPRSRPSLLFVHSSLALVLATPFAFKGTRRYSLWILRAFGY